MMRWGNGYHRERRAHPRPDEVMRDLPAAILMLVALWAFCALLFAVAG